MPHERERRRRRSRASACAALAASVPARCGDAVSAGRVAFAHDDFLAGASVRIVHRRERRLGRLASPCERIGRTMPPSRSIDCAGACCDAAQTLAADDQRREQRRRDGDAVSARPRRRRCGRASPGMQDRFRSGVPLMIGHIGASLSAAAASGAGDGSKPPPSARTRLIDSCKLARAADRRRGFAARAAALGATAPAGSCRGLRDSAAARGRRPPARSASASSAAARCSSTLRNDASWSTTSRSASASAWLYCSTAMS